MSCRILSTKKLVPELKQEAKQKNIDVSETEFISVKSILNREKWDEITEILKVPEQSVIFTSVNAVNAIGKYLHPYVNYFEPRWKIYSVQPKTKEALENCGPLSDMIFVTADNAADLAGQIIKQKEKDVVYFCGDQRRDELPDMLAAQNIMVHECVVYRTVESPVMIHEPFDGVLFFSPSAVKSFFSVNVLHETSVCFAIGRTTQRALEEQTKNQIITSKEPSQESIMESVYECFAGKNH